MLSPNELRDKADFLDGKNFGKSKSDEILAELCRQVAELRERVFPDVIHAGQIVYTHDGPGVAVPENSPDDVTRVQAME